MLIYKIELFLLILGPVFTPVNNGNISVTFNPNYTTNAIRLPYYSNGEKYVTLGYITDLGTTRQLHGEFSPLIYSSGDSPDVNNILDGTQNTFLYDYYYGTNNKNLCFDSSTGRVFINRNALINNQVFYLQLYSYETMESNQNDIFEGWYYSYAYNTIPTGVGINPNMTSDIDIGWINAFGDLTSYDEPIQENVATDLNKLLGNNFLSGDLFSGEIVGKLGYQDYYNNDYTLFIFTIYRNVLDLLSDNTTNSYIEFDLKGNNYTFYANDFAIPDSPLKTFVNLFLISGLAILFVQQMHAIIIRINTADLIGLTHSFNQSHTFFM